MPASPDDATIVHVLNRLGFGPRPGDVERVRQVGLASWIDRQLQPDRIADDAVDARLAGMPTLRMTSQQIAQEYLQPLLEQRQQRRREADAGAGHGPLASARPTRAPPSRQQQVLLQELVAQKLLRAVYSERQLQEVLVDFWFNHFNVFANKGLTRMYLTAYERDAIRPHVLGRFRDLLGATAKSPAMLVLSRQRPERRPCLRGEGQGRSRPAAARRPASGRARQQGREITPEMMEQVRQNIPTGINENYARELLELHTLGVDGGYTQQDIVDVARALTGWTIGRPRSAEAGQFWFNPRMHDTGDKVVLGQTIRGGGIEEGERVLDLLARHPSTARFIATKLARRFVADQPPRVARGTGRGDFSIDRRRPARGRAGHRDVARVLRPPTPGAPRSRPRSSSSSRRCGSPGPTCQTPWPLARTLQQQGMPLYLCQPPTGYKDTADAWVSSGALITRMNFAVELANGGARASSRHAAARRHLRGDPRDTRQGDDAGAGRRAGAGLAGISATVGDTYRQPRSHGEHRGRTRAPWQRLDAPSRG